LLLSAPTMADDTTHAHRRREFLWLLGGIGVLLIVGWSSCSSS